MSQEKWNAVDQYLVDRLVPLDPILVAALAASVAAELPSINVAPNQGKLLQILARMCRASRILEIGTLGGYSTIWLARALPAGGRLVTLEVDPRHADIARANFANASLSDVVDLRVGRASDTLSRLVAEVADPFDFVFIDADKPSTPEYFSWALRLTRLGSVIVVDNVIRDGEVANAESTDANVQGVRSLNDLISAEPRVSATAIQTVGSKGYDGFVIALVIDE